MKYGTNYLITINNTHMIKNTYLLFLLLLFGITGVMAQTVQIENVVKAPGDITVAVNMSGFNTGGPVQAIQLKIEFDDNLLYFKGIADPSFAGWVVPGNGAASPVIISWIKQAGQNVDGDIFDLKFGYAGGFSGSIKFVTAGCEVVRSLTAITGITYSDGSVTQTPAVATVDLGGSQQASVGSQVLVPVNMQGLGLTAVNAFTLKLAFDQSQLTFVQTANSVLGGMLAASSSNGVVTVTWNGSKNISALLDPNVFDLKFAYNGGGDASIVFKPGCQITNASLALVATAYTDGMVVPEPGTSTIEMPDVFTALNSEVLVPITLNYTGSDYIEGVNLNIGYDNTILVYKGILPGTIASGITASASNGVISIIWNKINNTASLNGALMSLKFACNALGSSPLSFEAGCTVTQKNLSNVILNYTDGSVTVCDATINTTPNGQPADVAVDYLSTAVFTVGVTNPCTYHWQVSINGGIDWADLANGGNYSGVESASLTIANTPLTFNGYKYRCFLGVITSNAATLTVNPVGFTVSGILKYANTTGPDRPITNSTVYLKTADGLTTLLTATTDASGNYSFSNVSNGSYLLTASTTKVWCGNDGVTLADYAIVRNFVNAGTPLLAGIYWLAADVNRSSDITLADYALIRNYVNTSSLAGWNSPGWIFVAPAISVLNANATNVVINGICSGDVNASYTPPL